MPASAVTQLTGTLPVMTTAWFTGTFAKRMLGDGPLGGTRRRRRSTSRRRTSRRRPRRNAFGGTSPI